MFIMAKNEKKEADYNKEPKVNVKEQVSYTTEMYDVFTLVKSEKEKKVMIAIGNNIVTRNYFKNTREAKDYINSKPWDLILNTCAVMQDMLKKNEEMKNSK